MTAVARSGCVFLLTDYGEVDEFAGLLRAAVARVAPEAPLVDLTHGIPPFDVVAGARALERCAAHLGPGVVVGVVDPGVGSDRRPVAVAVRGGPGPGALVGPDNGLLVPLADALGGATAAAVLPPPVGATTFDGRDVFAPAAARLWRGEPLDTVGTPIDPSTLVRLPAPHRSLAAGRLDAEVVWVDRFGNVQLAAGPADAAAAALADPAAGRVRAPLPVELAVRLPTGREVAVQLVRAFAELGVGGGAGSTAPGPGGGAGLAIGLVVDASGRLALCCDRASAAAELGLAVGDVVVVHEARAVTAGSMPEARARGARRRGEGGHR